LRATHRYPGQASARTGGSWSSRPINRHARWLVRSRAAIASGPASGGGAAAASGGAGGAAAAGGGAGGAAAAGGGAGGAAAAGGPAPAGAGTTTHCTASSHARAVTPSRARSANCQGTIVAGVGTQRCANRAQLVQNAQSPSYRNVSSTLRLSHCRRWRTDPTGSRTGAWSPPRCRVWRRNTDP